MSVAAPSPTRRDPLSWVVHGGTPAASHAMLAPAALWLAFFLVLPIAMLLALAFAQRGDYGSIVWTFSTANFARAVDTKYGAVLLRTLGYAGATTGLCLLLGFPVAYFLSFRAGRWRDSLLVLLMIPFWTSCLVSIYSWMILLGRDGLINSLLLRSGLVAKPLSLLNTPFSVLLGLVYFYLPFMVLPVYATLEKIPRAYLEAAGDLGATPWETFRSVTIPLSLPGIWAGCILTFIPCMGDFLTADFLGGPRTYLLGNLISNQFLMSQDWPFGAALTSLIVGAMLTGLYAYQRLEVEA